MFLEPSRLRVVRSPGTPGHVDVDRTPRLLVVMVVRVVQREAAEGGEERLDAVEPPFVRWNVTPFSRRIRPIMLAGIFETM